MQQVPTAAIYFRENHLKLERIPFISAVGSAFWAPRNYLGLISAASGYLTRGPHAFGTFFDGSFLCIFTCFDAFIDDIFNGNQKPCY